MDEARAMPYPAGWFVVAFSDEIPKMGVKSLRYFGGWESLPEPSHLDRNFPLDKLIVTY